MSSGPKLYYRNLIMSYVFCVIIAFLPIIRFTHRYIAPKTLEKSTAQTMEIIRSKSNELGSWLNQRISEIEILEQYPDVVDLNLDSMKPFIADLNAAVREIYGNPEETFAIGGADGLGYINDRTTINVSERDYFIEAMKTDKKYVISSPVISKSDNNPIFLICHPIRNRDNETVGFINGSVNLYHFSSITDNIDVYNGTAWIMNRNGEFYTGGADTQAVYSDFVPEILSKATETSGTISLNVAGESITLFYSSVPYADSWILCDAIRTKELTSYSDTMQNCLLGGALLACILIFITSFTMSHKIVNDNRKLIKEVSDINERERKAQIRALQSQINPHFLYNTLDTIQWKALDYKAYDIADMIQKLSRIFRISLSNGREFIPLENEIEHVKNYLDIQKIRYNEKIDYEIDISNDVVNVVVPKLIIQPLVENSIYHGIKPSDKNGTIKIDVKSEGTMIKITVSDNGVGMNDGDLENLKHDLDAHKESDHYGLYNVNEKLFLTYGNDYTMRLKNKNGFTVEILIPDRSLEG